ncbi:HSP20-like chaperone [Histomonas meleagridis]|uniref:HSP20-like chaperone n=1 Tax=Histomonas meleagridis TaxID=135588 RepID=UPI00355A1107|nr:HSP20-like chaperone [Histomonas meleagridis]KAH0799313.1 HSP20-like chaperone [Histomonas meleagridis]
MWAQGRTTVYVTIKLQDVQDEEIQFNPNCFIFKGRTVSPDQKYDLNLELFDEIDPTDKETRYVKYGRYIQLNLRKRNSSVWWPRLAKTTQKLHYVKIDWEKWVDDDEDFSASDDQSKELPNLTDKDMTDTSDEEEANNEENQSNEDA